jgi:hypothetical protein
MKELCGTVIFRERGRKRQKISFEKLSTLQKNLGLRFLIYDRRKENIIGAHRVQKLHFQ